MTLPPEAAAWLEKYEGVAASSPAAGGCINNGAHLRTYSGAAFFFKCNPDAPADMFARETEGLVALAATKTLRVPGVHLAGDDFLLLEDLQPAPRAADYWQQLGRGLAALHSHTHAQFGFAHGNYIGSTPQPNGWLADGYAFFAERRLGYQARLAHAAGRLRPAKLPPLSASLRACRSWCQRSRPACCTATCGPVTPSRIAPAHRR